MSRRRARRLYAKALKYERQVMRHELAAKRLQKRMDTHVGKAQHFSDLASRYDDLSREARNEH